MSQDERTTVAVVDLNDGDRFRWRGQQYEIAIEPGRYDAYLENGFELSPGS